MTKVSVIIPVYNVEKYLRECLDSVINQTLKDIEIVCIDDKSTDDSLNILKEYASKDSRIKIVEQKVNQGQGIARNCGIDIAQGEYIMFLDSDDWYELDACEKAYNRIKEKKTNICLFEHYKFDENNKTKKPARYMTKAYMNYLNNDIVNFKNVDSNYLSAAYTVIYIYDKKFLNDNSIRYSNDRIGEDVVFISQVLVNLETLSILNEPLYNYRKLNNKQKKGSSLDANAWKSIFHCRKIAMQIIMKSDNKNLHKAFLIYYINTVIYWYKVLTSLNKQIKKEYYLEMQKLFKDFNTNYDINSIKTLICYRDFSKIIKYNWIQYQLYTFLKHIFSIENILKDSIKHKIIYFLGIEFEIIIGDYSPEGIKKNYQKQLNRIKKKKKPIRVAFLVAENSKWASDSLYNLFKKDKNFEPFILLNMLKSTQNSIDTTRRNTKENQTFFESRGMKTVFAYKGKKYKNLKKCNFDILFYEQPWSLPKKYNPDFVSDYALTFYIPYGLSLLNYSMDYDSDFCEKLYKLFIDSKVNLKRFQTYSNYAVDNCVITGYLKLDKYLSPNIEDSKKYWKNPEKFKIIYAPHHSFEENSLKLATFKENGQYILDLAKSHPETTWVFKPHPRFKFAILNNSIMTEQEIDDYYTEWEEFGNIYTQGDYIDLFRTSNLMITDCASFLAEYLPSGNPIIRPTNKNSISLNPLGEKIVEGYYQTSNNDELLNAFNKLVLEKNDDKKDIRSRFCKNFIDYNETSAHKVYKYLKNLLEV